LQEANGLGGPAAADEATQLFDRLSDGGEVGGSKRGLSFEELVGDEFDAELLPALSRLRAAAERTRTEKREREQSLAAERKMQDDWEQRPWTPAMLNDDRSLDTRILAALPYVLPLFDRLGSALPLVAAAPILMPLFDILEVPYGIYEVFPFITQVWWFSLTLLANNRRLPRLIRFSLQQAVLLDIAFFSGTFVATVVYGATGGAVETAENLLGGPFYVLLFGCVLYCWGCCALGRDPDGIPVVSEFTKKSLDAPPPPGFGSD
jgi:hypothetical protein